MEDEETLKTRALVSQLPDAVQNQIHYFFANGVMAAGVVVGGVFLASDELFWVEELSVLPCSDLICKKTEESQSSGDRPSVFDACHSK